MRGGAVTLAGARSFPGLPPVFRVRAEPPPWPPRPQPARPPFLSSPRRAGFCSLLGASTCAATALEEEEAANEEEREGEVAEGAEEGAVVGRRGLHREDHILLGQDLDELRRLLGQHERLMPVAVLVDGERLLAVGCEGDLLDLARLDRVEEGRVRPGRGGAVGPCRRHRCERTERTERRTEVLATRVHRRGGEPDLGRAQRRVRAESVRVRAEEAAAETEDELGVDHFPGIRK